jgi:hypothetical protein
MKPRRRRAHQKNPACTDLVRESYGASLEVMDGAERNAQCLRFELMIANGVVFTTNPRPRRNSAARGAGQGKGGALYVFPEARVRGTSAEVGADLGAPTTTTIALAARRLARRLRPQARHAGV